MILITNFEQYEPTDDYRIELKKTHNVSFIRTPNGDDWYDINKTFEPEKIKVMFNLSSNIIVSEGYDASSMNPYGYGFAVLDIEHTDSTLIGKVLNLKTGKVTDYKQTVAEKTADAERKVLELRSEVSPEFESLKIAQEISTLTPAEEKRMLKIKQYLVDLMRVKDQDGYPNSITWPKLKK